MPVRKHKPTCYNHDGEKGEATVTLLTENNKKQSNSKPKLKRKRKTLVVVFSTIVLINVLVVLLIFADCTLPLRCQISEWIGILLAKCRAAGILASLAWGNQTLTLETPQQHENGSQQIAANDTYTYNPTYIATAASTWATAMELLHDTDGWQLKDGSDLTTGRVSFKTYHDFGTVALLEGYIDCTPHEVFRIMVGDVYDIPEWDTTIEHSEIIEKVSESLDIHYMITGAMAGGLISEREHLNLRYWKEEDGIPMYVGSTVTHPAKPPTDDYIRATTRPGGMIFYPVKEDRKRCRLKMSLSADVGGMRWIPQWALDKGMASSLLRMLEDVRNRCQSLYH